MPAYSRVDCRKLEKSKLSGELNELKDMRRAGDQRAEWGTASKTGTGRVNAEMWIYQKPICC